MKKFILVFLSLYSALQANSQILFAATISDQISSNTFAVWKTTPLPSDNLLMNGTTGSNQGFMLEYNGGTVFYNTYSAFSNILDANFASDGSFFAAGLTSTSRLTIMKTDASGNPLWTKERAGAGFYMNGFVIPKNGGGCFAGGGGFGLDTLFICEFDSAGTLLWQKSYDVYLSVFENRFAQPTSDNGLIICSTLGSAGGACLLKLDSLGNIQWQKAYPAAGHGVSVRPVGSGYFMTCFGSSNHLAIETDSAGNVLWSSAWPIYYNGNLAEHPFHVITEGTSRTVSGTRFTGNNCSAAIAGFDPSGNLSLSASLPYYTSDNGSDAVSAYRNSLNGIGFTKIITGGNLVWSVTADSSAMITCSSGPPLISTTAANITDGACSITPHIPPYTWTTVTNTATPRSINLSNICNPLNTEIENEKNAVTSYPNPADDQIKFSFEASVNPRIFSIYDARGVLVSRQKIESGKNQLNIITDQFPAGIYCWKMEDAGNSFSSGRMIITH